MKEEELIKKLESVELPEIEPQSHQRRLRMALLNAGYLQRQKSKGGIDMIRSLVSRQPIWKTAVIGIMALTLITGLAITLPSLTGQSAEALAAEIAQNSPQVRTFFGEGEVTVKEVKVVDGKGVVLLEGELGGLTAASVDLETQEVTEVVSMPELTEAEKEEAIAIAKADPRVQELLDQGASIGRVASMISIFVDIEDGKDDFTCIKSAHIDLRLGDRTWFAHINLEGKKVERLIEIERMDITKKSGAIGEVFYFQMEEGPVEEPVSQ